MAQDAWLEHHGPVTNVPCSAEAQKPIRRLLGWLGSRLRRSFLAPPALTLPAQGVNLAAYESLTLTLMPHEQLGGPCAAGGAVAPVVLRAAAAPLFPLAWTRPLPNSAALLLL